MRLAPSSRIYPLATHDVATLQWGPSDGRLLVALHGFPDTAWTWRTLAPLLADQGFLVVAPFMRGYAPSGIPSDGDYSVRALARDAMALHDALRGGDDAVLVGHDWGAIAADLVAGRSDSPFSRVVALAVPPLPWINPTRETLAPWLGALARQPFHSWYIALNQIPGLSERIFERLTAKLWRDWSPGYDATEDLAFLRDATPSLSHRRAAVSYYRAIASKGSRAALVEPIHPLLSLQGDRDGALDPGFFPAVSARTNSTSRSELIPGTGHFLHLEQPEVIADRILEFLA
ncbi:MAG: alpha/beta fold hydrolase [Marmoricola sp.]